MPERFEFPSDISEEEHHRLRGFEYCFRAALTEYGYDSKDFRLCIERDFRTRRLVFEVYNRRFDLAFTETMPVEWFLDLDDEQGFLRSAGTMLARNTLDAFRNRITPDDQQDIVESYENRMWDEADELRTPPLMDLNHMRTPPAYDNYTAHGGFRPIEDAPKSLPKADKRDGVRVLRKRKKPR